MKNLTHKVVCSFSGRLYSRHTSEEHARRAAEREARSLNANPNCGSLGFHVEVHPIGARFTRIIPADNDCGCVQVSSPRWVE
jgi:hypothetical protein